MELSILWVVLATTLIAMVRAESTNRGLQMFVEAKTTTTANPPPQKQHKRQPQYAGMRWREVIMYLTPSQIRALESGQARIEAQTTAQFELPKGQLPDIPKTELSKGELPITEPLKAELPTEESYKALKNNGHEEGQKLQREYENFEADRKHRIQLAEAVQSQPSKELSQAHQTQSEIPQVSAQRGKKYPEFLPQFQLVPGPSPELQKIALPERKLPFRSNNYAYLYFYPQGRPQNNQKLQSFYPELEENRPQQLVYHNEKSQEHYLNPYLQQKFQIVPYDYELLKGLQAQPLQSHAEDQQLEAQQYEAHRLEAQKLEAQQLEAQPLEAQLENQQLQTHKLENQQLKDQRLQEQLEGQLLQAQELEAQQLQAHQLQAKLEKQHLEMHKLEAQHQLQEQQEKQQLQTQNLEAQQQIHAHLEKQQLQAQLRQAHRLEAQQLQEQLEVQILDAQELAAHQLDNNFINALQYIVAQRHEKDQLKAFNFQGNVKEIDKLEVKILEAEKLKEKYEAHQREAQKLDEHLEAQQLKAEQDRAEAEAEHQQPFQFYGDFDSNKGQIYSLFSPLLQRYNLEESLNQKKLHSTPKLEGGFVPSQQYAPKYNYNKYIKEVEKMLRDIHFEKQNSLVRAAPISKTPPVLVNEEVQITKHPINLNIKHVNVPVPAPYYVPVPEPFEVKVPQPYAVPLEIIRPVPIPIVKTEKLEVEKPIPFEVEKRVPYPVTKNVFVNVDKPYFVKKIVPVEIKKKIPVEIPIRKPQKLSIIRHVWEH